MKVIPYLGFDGNCEEAFRYYEKHLGGKIMAIMHAKGSPMEEHVDKRFHDRVMHACMEIDGQLIMASDSFEESFAPAQGTHVMLDVDSIEQAERFFAALSDGGKIGMALQETFWAHRHGNCTDRFGTLWMVNGPAKDFDPNQ